MDDRLSDLLTRLRARFAADAAADEVEAFLSSEGYDRRQIGEILSLFFGEIAPPSARLGKDAHGVLTFRVLGPHERGRFASDAWGHLLSLSSSGAINAGELEHIIERALTHIDGRIALDDLRALMEGAGYDDLGPASERTTIH